MIGVIAAHTNRKVSDSDVAAYMAAYPDTLDSDDEVRRFLTDEGCSEDYRLMFGQRSRREEWHCVDDPTAKHSLPAEVEFRKQWTLPTDQDSSCPEPRRKDIRSIIMTVSWSRSLWVFIIEGLSSTSTSKEVQVVPTRSFAYDQNIRNMTDVCLLGFETMSTWEDEYKCLAEWNIDGGHFFWVEVRSIGKSRACITILRTHIASAIVVEPLFAMKITSHGMTMRKWCDSGRLK